MGKCRGKDAASVWIEVSGEIKEEVKEYSWTMSWNWIRAEGRYEQKQSNASPAL